MENNQDQLKMPLSNWAFFNIKSPAFLAKTTTCETDSVTNQGLSANHNMKD